MILFLKKQCRSPTTALLEWNEPSFNGAMVTEYRLQLAIVSSRKCLSPPTITLSQSSSSTSSSVADLDEDLDDLDDDDLDLEDDDIEEDDFEHQESLDSEEDLEPLAASKKRVVKRKRKSVRNENDSNSDSDDEEPAVHRRHGGREKTLEDTADDHETEIIKSTKLNELKSVEDLEDLEDLEDDELLDDDELPKELLFTNIFTGPSRSFEARSLEPATTYQFRVCAVNSAGASEWSEITEASTPPAAPTAVSGLHLKDSSATSLTLGWTRPQSNGEHITHHNIDTGSSVIPTEGPDTYFHVESLK